MNAPINIQIITGPDGQPAYAVIPYSTYLGMTQRDAPMVPNEVVGKVIKQDMTPIRAWREHLGLTQNEVAQRLGISQPAYAAQENSVRLRKSSRVKIAAALGLADEQLAL